jgi:RNA polymerase sigma factor (sigma-70 family)
MAKTNEQIHQHYQAYLAGERGAERRFFIALRKALTLMARRLLGRRGAMLGEADIDEVVQELLIAVWAQDLVRYDPARGELLAFLNARVRWRLSDAVRLVCQHAERYEVITASFDAELEGSHPDEQLEVEQTERRLRLLPSVADEHLKKLRDPAARRAVRESLDGASLRLIAQRLGQSPSTVTRARNRAIAHLREDVRFSMRMAA